MAEDGGIPVQGLGAEVDQCLVREVKQGESKVEKTGPQIITATEEMTPAATVTLVSAVSSLSVPLGIHVCPFCPHIFTSCIECMSFALEVSLFTVALTSVSFGALYWSTRVGGVAQPIKNG
jgi:hypothetical protein